MDQAIIIALETTRGKIINILGLELPTYQLALKHIWI